MYKHNLIYLLKVRLFCDVNMPISLSFTNFPTCPKCGNSNKAPLVPVYEFSGGNPQKEVMPTEILFWKCSNPQCGTTIEP